MPLLVTPSVVEVSPVVVVVPSLALSEPALVVAPVVVVVAPVVDVDADVVADVVAASLSLALLSASSPQPAAATKHTAIHEKRRIASSVGNPPDAGAPADNHHPRG
ncbi:MAG: hypothetical protein KC486_06290 [Myxococcales bacterium]|nr:hypothetical protein [Myxococcales bacterium]